MSANSKLLRKYMIFTGKSKMMQSRQTKSTGEKEPSKSENRILKIISDAKESSSTSKSQVALLAVTFPLIAHQFKENPDYLFRVIDVSGFFLYFYLIQ